LAGKQIDFFFAGFFSHIFWQEFSKKKSNKKVQKIKQKYIYGLLFDPPAKRRQI